MRKTSLVRVAFAAVGFGLVAGHWISGNTEFASVLKDVKADVMVLPILIFFWGAAMVDRRRVKAFGLVAGLALSATLLGWDVQTLGETPWAVVAYNPSLWVGLALMAVSAAIGVLPPRRAPAPPALA